MQFLLLGLNAASVLASPRNLFGSNQKRNAGSGAGQGPPNYDDGSWGPKSEGGQGPSGYGDGSWGHSTKPQAPTSYGGGSDGWGHSTCEASTVYETSISTVYESASTVYVSGSGFASYLPASTITVAGQGHTSVETAYETVTQPAAPTTIYLTRQGPGWNHTITREETDVHTTTEHDYSTIVDEETVFITSQVTLPGNYPP